MPPSAGKNAVVNPLSSNVRGGDIAWSTRRSVPSLTPTSSMTTEKPVLPFDARPSAPLLAGSPPVPATTPVSRGFAGAVLAPSPSLAEASGTIQPVFSSGRTSRISGRTSRMLSTRSSLRSNARIPTSTSIRPTAIDDVSPAGAVRLAGLTPRAPRRTDNSTSPSSASQPVASRSTCSICGLKLSASINAGRINTTPSISNAIAPRTQR